MPNDFTMMAIKIQHIETSELYAFATYLQEKLHESLIEARNDKENLKFKHYYFVI